MKALKAIGWIIASPLLLVIFFVWFCFSIPLLITSTIAENLGDKDTANFLLDLTIARLG